ncbi:minor capsid protein [Horseradish latent virus]|uniref:Virion-associated protein n=1 Tax=Horseradish latent virus TaxID=264076 RepID=Q5J1S3_9VIRU|nr:minor capsid protein [Horseradish latent virus]AAW56087.1 minor capsid protein [Horseradish latent virus]
MANLNQIQKEVSQALEEIRSLKKDTEAILAKLGSTEPNNLEAIAAKIINDVTKVIRDCPCNKEILEAFAKQPEKKGEIIPSNKPGSSSSKLKKYSYPNTGVGNSNLGSSENPKALTWPFGS